MAVSTNDTAAARPVSVPLHVFSTRFARRKLFDRLARHAVTLGGLVIIGSILAILFVILTEVVSAAAAGVGEPATRSAGHARGPAARRSDRRIPDRRRGGDRGAGCA